MLRQANEDACSLRSHLLGLQLADNSKERIGLPAAVVGVALEDVVEAARDVALAVVVVATVPADKGFESGGVELDELAVQYTLVGVDADLHRSEIDGVDLDEHWRSNDVASLFDPRDLAGPEIEPVRHLVVVDQIDARPTEECEADEDDDQEDDEARKQLAPEVGEDAVDSLTDVTIHDFFLSVV